MGEFIGYGALPDSPQHKQLVLKTAEIVERLNGLDDELQARIIGTISLWPDVSPLISLREVFDEMGSQALVFLRELGQNGLYNIEISTSSSTGNAAEIICYARDYNDTTFQTVIAFCLDSSDEHAQWQVCPPQSEI